MTTFTRAHAATLSIFAAMTLVILPTFTGGISVAEAQSNTPIYMQEKEVGRITDLRILPGQGENTRIEIKAMFSSFPENLDQVLIAKKDLAEGCKYKLHWRGQTSIRGAEASKLHLSSGLAFEQWICFPKRRILGVTVPLNKLNFNLLGDAVTVQWTLFVNPARIDELHVSAKLTNIVGYPDWLEDLFGLQITRNIKVRIPDLCERCKCSEIIEGTALTFEGATFSVENERDVKVVATVAVSNDLAAVLGCF